ncbi:hypothetical protein KIN20_031022 [Parelaphostrongylus tenuis]|uniref:Uncharacterized protein n=1 Tax=Parelaphostrongylus tenuis TaxID=148309 RepID=A0AAD5R4I8_PARTN|nr:hypothetical protein KIN20_031022 [Parelaphostrongylus tenuis]
MEVMLGFRTLSEDGPSKSPKSAGSAPLEPINPLNQQGPENCIGNVWVYLITFNPYGNTVPELSYDFKNDQFNQQSTTFARDTKILKQQRKQS